jgi:hypothetical protein
MEKKEPNGLYFIVFTYYDEYKDKTETTQCLVLAPNHGEAINAIANDYKWIDEITVREWISPRICDDGVNYIFLPDDQNIISAIADANDEY